MTACRGSVITIADNADCSDPRLGHYGAFKHGGHLAVVAMADAIAALACRKMRSEWHADIPGVVTSPPFAAIPSASHYLAEAVHRNLTAAGVWPGSVYMPLRKRAIGVGADYAGLTRRERQESQQRQTGLILDPALDLRGRHVVVVNDIRVTGHQERALDSYLRSCATPVSVSWLYLVEVTDDFGSSNPDVERRLNLRGVHTDDEFVAFLCRTQWSPTARGIRRLLALPAESIRQALRNTSPAMVQSLAQLAQAELLCTARDFLGLAVPA